MTVMPSLGAGVDFDAFSAIFGALSLRAGRGAAAGAGAARGVTPGSEEGAGDAAGTETLGAAAWARRFDGSNSIV